MPTKVAIIELGQPLPKTIEDAENYDRVWVIVMRYGIPIRQLTIHNCRTPILEDQLRSEIGREMQQHSR